MYHSKHHHWHHCRIPQPNTPTSNSSASSIMKYNICQYQINKWVRATSTVLRLSINSYTSWSSRLSTTTTAHCPTHQCPRIRSATATSTAAGNCYSQPPSSKMTTIIQITPITTPTLITTLTPTPTLITTLTYLPKFWLTIHYLFQQTKAEWTTLNKISMSRFSNRQQCNPPITSIAKTATIKHNRDRCRNKIS